MQHDDVEVQFCDLCGTSVPLSDLEKGAAIRHQAKTIGACCLEVLRRGDSPLAAVGAPAAATATAATAPPEEARPARDGQPLVVLAMLLVALLAVVLYLDQRISAAAKPVVGELAQARLAQQSDSEVLQAVGVAVDGLARKADLEALLERLHTLEQTQAALQEQWAEQAAAQGKVLGSLLQETRQLSASAVDYRPLFDDLRAQQNRISTTLADLRALPAPAAAKPEVVAEAPAVAPPPAVVDSLPEVLAAAVRKLGSTDPAVRFEAVATLVDSKNLGVLRSLLPMTGDADAFVRRLTVEGLRDFRHVDAVEALLQAMTDKDPTVAETAWNSLKKLTGQQFPFDPTSPNKDLQRRALQRWTEWWEKNKGSFGA